MRWFGLFLVGLMLGVPSVRAQDSTSPGAVKSEGPAALLPGDHSRDIEVEGVERNYLVHVPPNYDAAKPTPLVFCFHGLGMPVALMPPFCALNETSDKHGFVVVYPAGLNLMWNARARKGPLSEVRVDDVEFVRQMLAELKKSLNVDARRVYATGMSNGGMFSYLLAQEMSDQIAAIAPVAGTMTFDEPSPPRPVPVIHFHGTADNMVPFDKGRELLRGRFVMKSIPETIKAWAKFNGCKEDPVETPLADKEADETTVKKLDYGKGRDGAEVVMYVIEGGGHTWPGVKPPLKIIGTATLDISANELMWEFFQRHPLPEVAKPAAEKK